MTDQKNEKIFILIPVNNRRETTLSCLRSLHTDAVLANWQDLSIVMIDDGSTDGTELAVKSEFPAVKVLLGNGDLWWTGAITKGMEYAIKQQCAGIFWLNDDCPPTPDSLVKMHLTSLNYDNAIIGASCYISKTGGLQPTGARGRTRIAAQPGELLSVDEMSGHCVYIPRVVIDKIGFPDVRHFPHYHGDSNYVLRATRNGFKAYLLGDAKVSHAEIIKAKLEDFSLSGGTSPINSFRQTFLNKKSLYYLPTQFFYTTGKYGDSKGAILFLLKLFHWLSKWIVLTLAIRYR